MPLDPTAVPGEPLAPLSLAAPDISARERELVEQVLASDVLSQGTFIGRFEAEIARQTGRAFGIACSSGTAALHMIVRALGIGDGDEVITTPFSFIASANCVVYERGKPVFVDIEEETLGLDPGLVEDAATDRTAAILPVHVFGQPCRIHEIEALAADRSWRVVEDSCEAFGSSSSQRAMGSFGDASAFAFYPNKQITTGEGGVVLTDDEEIAAVCRSLRNQGRDDSSEWLRHVRLGYNYRLDEMSAAIGLAQLERAGELRARRSRLAGLYAAALGDIEGVTPPNARTGDEVDWFVYVVRVDASVDRDGVMSSLAAAGVPSRPYFSPLHLQPVYRELLGHREGDFPVTERVARSTLALPWSTRMGESEVGRVAEALRLAVGRR